MKHLSTLLLITCFSINFQIYSQQTLLSEDFESGYTNDADIGGVNNWQVFAGGAGKTAVVKTINNAGEGYNSSDWYLEISTGAFQAIQQVFELISGETYEFKIQAKRAGTFNGGLKIAAYLLDGNGGSNLIVESPTQIVNSAYNEKLVTFTADASTNHGFRIIQNFGSASMRIDNVEITCTTCSTASISDIVDSNFTIYPNPANNIVNISSDSSFEKIEVFSITGKKVYSEKYIQAIPVNSLKSGIYILKAISNDGKIITRKLIKE